MNVNEAFGAYKRGDSNKFVILNTDQYDTESFIQAVKRVSEASIYNYDDADQFFEGVSASTDFDETRNFHILYGLRSESYELALSTMDYVLDKDVVLILVNKKVSKNKAFSQLITKVTYAEPTTLKDFELADVLNQKFIDNNYMIPKKAVEFLVKRTGGDKFSIFSEIKKLEHLKPEKKFSEDDIKRLLPIPLKEDFFDFIESFMNRESGEVFSKLRGTSQQEYIRLIRSIQTELSKVYRVSGLVASGKDSRQIAEITGYNAWVVRNRYQSYAKLLGKARVSKMLGVLSDAESKLKHTKFDKTAIMELYFIKALMV